MRGREGGGSEYVGPQLHLDFGQWGLSAGPEGNLLLGLSPRPEEGAWLELTDCAVPLGTLYH